MRVEVLHPRVSDRARCTFVDHERRQSRPIATDRGHDRDPLPGSILTSPQKLSRGFKVPREDSFGLGDPSDEEALLIHVVRVLWQNLVLVYFLADDREVSVIRNHRVSLVSLEIQAAEISGV